MTISQLALAAKLGGALRSVASTRIEIHGVLSGTFSRCPGTCVRNLMLAGLGFLMWQQAGATSSAILSWDANPEPDIAGYTVSYGTAPGVYDRSLEAGNSTETEVVGLEEGSTYYFAVAAFNQAGYRSPNSDEVSYFVELEVPANQAPVANAASVSGSEGQSIPITLSGSDANGDTLTFLVINSPVHGTLNGTSPNLTYTPAADFNGSDSFTFKANDGKADSNIATVSITISAINHAPVATAAALTTAEDTSLPVILTGTDRDNNPLTFTISAGPSHGKLTGTPPNLTYTPNANYFGPDQFSFTASDGNLTSAPSLVMLTVTAVNDAPLVAGSTLTTQENKSLAVKLTGSDADGDPLTYSVVKQPTHGSFTGTSPNLTYTPTTGYSGSDSFTFKANDGKADSNIATVSITIAAINHAPVATGGSFTTAEDIPLPLKLAGTDPDGNTLTFTVSSSPSHGKLTGTAPNLTYTPNANYNGTDLFSFTASDGTLNSPAALIAIIVTAVNDAPVVAGTALITQENKALPITLTGSDVDGDSLTYSVVKQPTHGAITGTSPYLTYTPTADYNGSDSFTFKANDGKADSNIATMGITISGINHAPIATAGSLTIAEDIPVSLTLAATDPDGNPLTFTVGTSPSHGKLTGTAPNLTYTPDANYNGSDQFSFTASDSNLASAPAVIALTVTAVNDAPVVADNSLTTGSTAALPVTLTGSDVDGDPLTFSVVTQPIHGTLSGTAPDLTYTANTGFSGSDSLTFKANDGKVDSNVATMTITVTGGVSEKQNAAPIFVRESFTFPAGTEKIAYWRQSLASTASDPDAGDRITFSRTYGPNWLSLAEDGTLGGTPPVGSAGLNRFTIRATDRLGAYSETTLEITIVANRLPLPWTLKRLGKGRISDPANYAAGVFTLGGSGALEETADSGAFGWQKVGENGVITARIRRIKNTGKDTRVGLMIRQSLASGARQSFIGVDGKGKLHWLRRTKANQATTDSTFRGKKSANGWLRLERSGNTLSAYRSSDGKTWEKVASSRIKLPKNCYIGLSVSSGDDDVRNTSKFSNVRVTP